VFRVVFSLRELGSLTEFFDAQDSGLTLGYYALGLYTFETPENRRKEP